mmetsp:Transcript_14096/g.43560  ORF Transcript_14096/g.43560 Transcript_14096/m.43560 type:complete len:232 (-) Transcript_14096:694-1389(-)
MARRCSDLFICGMDATSTQTRIVLASTSASAATERTACFIEAMWTPSGSGSCHPNHWCEMKTKRMFFDMAAWWTLWSVSYVSMQSRSSSCDLRAGSARNASPRTTWRCAWNSLTRSDAVATCWTTWTARSASSFALRRANFRPAKKSHAIPTTPRTHATTMAAMTSCFRSRLALLFDDDDLRGGARTIRRTIAGTRPNATSQAITSKLTVGVAPVITPCTETATRWRSDAL